MLKLFKLTGILILMHFTALKCLAQMPETYFESSYGRLEYGFYVPSSYDETKQYPLVMYLHGWSNNYTVYLHYYDQEIQGKNPCFVFTPKTPTDWADWSSWSWDGTGFSSLSEPTKAALHVMDSLIGEYNIDTNRLYVYGISMGGEGVFDLLHKIPGKFAAGISICGGGFAHWAENISETPFWMFHGGSDEVNPPELTERVYQSLLDMGATRMRYTNYPGYGHAIWDKAQSEPSFFDWMFTFRKNSTSCESPIGNITLSGTVADEINLSWNDIRNENTESNKIWYYKIFNSEGLLNTVEYNITQYSFTPTNETDTFWIQAVNYCFESSEPSNVVIYNQGVISSTLNGDMEKDPINIYSQNHSIYIDISELTPAPVSVQLVSLEGKLLMNKSYPSSGQFVLDVPEHNKGICIIKVSTENQLYSKKLMFY